nr:hypothetical protein [Tanacetum cinerariifolium]
MVVPAIEEVAEPVTEAKEEQEVNEEWPMAPVTPPLVPAGQPMSVNERINQVSDAKVAASVTIRELGPRIYAVEGQVQGVNLMPTLRRDLLRDVNIQKLRWLVSRLKVRSGEDLSYVRCMLPLMYQLMAVKKTSFLEMECSGSIVVSMPDVVDD